MTTKLNPKFNKVSTKPLKSTLGINDTTKILNKGKKLDKLPSRAYELQKQLVDGYKSYDINKQRKTQVRIGDKLDQIIELEYNISPNSKVIINSKIAIKLDVNNVYLLHSYINKYNSITQSIESILTEEISSGIITFNNKQYHVMKYSNNKTWHLKDIDESKELSKIVFDRYKSNSKT